MSRVFDLKFCARIFALVAMSWIGSLEAGEVILDIPYSKQFQAFTCGHESFRMVLAHWGQRESREKILVLMGASGSNGDEIEELIKSHYKDFRFEYVPVDFQAIKQKIDAKRPIMIGVDAGALDYLDYDSSSGHAIVVVGYNDADQRVFVRDPNSPYVEQISFEKLKRAALNGDRSAFAVYRASGSPAPGPAKDFDEGFRPNAAKKKEQGIPLRFLVPSLYLSYETLQDTTVAESFRKSTVDRSLNYTLLWNGISYGNQTLEQTPWLGGGKQFVMGGASLAWVLGGGLRFGPGEQLSPGIYSFGHNRIMDVHNFSSIKRIPALNLNRWTVEASGYVKPHNDEFLYYGGLLGLKLRAWGGGRIGVRKGLSQMLGHLSLGVSPGQVDVVFNNADKGHTVDTMNYDLTLGILKFAAQTADLASESASGSEHDGLRVRAYSGGIDYNLGSISSNLSLINALNYTGIFRPHLEYKIEFTERDFGGNTWIGMSKRKWEVELPVNMHVLDLIYGFGFEKATQFASSEDSIHSAWVRLAFNAYLPFVQLTTGYKLNYGDSDKVISQQMSFGMYAGI